MAGGATGVVFVSSHGFQQNTHAYILPHDAFQTGEQPTAVAVDALVKSLGKGRAYLFVDACRSPANYTLRPADEVNDAANLDAMPELFALFSAGHGGNSYELKDQRQGAFTFGLLETLYQTSNRKPIERVTLTKDVARVLEQLKTSRLQRPRDAGGLFDDEPLTPLMRIPRPRAAISSLPRRTPPPIRIIPAAYVAQDTAAPNQEDLMREAMAQLSPGRITEDVARRAVAACCRGTNADPEVKSAVRIALEEAGQNLLTRYLDGEENPPEPEQFRRGATYYELAHELLPDSRLLQARVNFNRGRLRLFDLIGAPENQKPAIFGSAAAQLSEAQLAHPGGGYILNALGIGYLETANPDRAAAAFRDAIQEAPEWAYPRHNLALTHMQMGARRMQRRSTGRQLRRTPTAFTYTSISVWSTSKRTTWDGRGPSTMLSNAS